MTFNLRLTGLAALGLLGLAAAPARAQDAAPVVAELFTTQACVFCPQADRLFAELAARPDVIALACHIDYFDVRRGSLSRPFCSARQSWYAAALASGPRYTPQMVVQGRYDALGYEKGQVAAALDKAEEDRIVPLAITPVAVSAGAAEHGYRLSLPDGAALPAGRTATWVAVYDAPHGLTVSGGRNRGKAMTYYNAVSAMKDMGPWTGAMSVRVVPAAQAQGFAVLVQDKVSGAVLAAGKYEIARGDGAGD